MKGLVLLTADVPLYKTFEEPAYLSLGKQVGGCIEIVRNLKDIPSDIVMVVNENGHFENLDFNYFATLLYGYPIVGDVVIVKEGMVDGEPDLVSLSAAEATSVFCSIMDLVVNDMDDKFNIESEE